MNPEEINWNYDKICVDDRDISIIGEEMKKITDSLPNRVNLNPENVQNGLAKLVLSLVELIRRLLERQALRRMEAGSLTSEETERLGCTFMKLEETMEQLKSHFNLKDDDLNINLGPLGDLW